MLPSEELLQSIDILAQNAVKDSVKIYTAIVTAVGNDNTCSVRANGKTHSGIAYYGDVPSVNKSYRVFCPNGSMNQAFIITGGGSGSLPIASADTLGGIKVGAGLAISDQGTLSVTGGGTADAVEWANVLDKPTTISGYKITDAKIEGDNIVLGDNTMTPYTANNTPPYPVTSVNGQTGAVVIPTGGNVDSVNGKTGEVVLTASDVGALPSDTTIPSKTSQLENDSGYITSSALNGYAKTADIPTKTSQLQNNSGFITADDVPVKSVDGATGAVVTNAVKTTEQTLTDAQKQQARTNIGAGTSSFDGDYNSLSNKPAIPTKTSDITNDSGYITSADVPVKSVNGQTGAVVLDAEAVGALPDTTAIPSKTSDLTNDSGYITNAALDGYAKEADIPTNNNQLTNGAGYITASDIPVQSVNGKTGAVQLGASDVGALPDTTVIPTSTSDLTNDSGYITSNDIPVKSVNNKTGVVTLTASDVGALPDSTVIPSKTSQLDNDSGYITEIPIASSTVLGGVKVGGGLSITAGGVLSATGGGTADAVEWNNVLDKPTTISGYGITDAKIENGTITLGANSIKPYGATNPPPYPVKSVNGQTGNVVIPTGGNVDSVNGKTGEVVLNADDVGALPSTTVIPDKTSQLDNDSGYITNSALTGYAKKTEIPTKTSELTNDSGYITNTVLEPYAKTADVPTKTSQLDNDSGFITDAALTGYAKTTDIPTKTSQLDNDSHYITASGAPVQSVNTKTGAVVLTQDDVGDGTTYVRTHNDFTDVLKTQINTNEDNIAMLDGDIEGLQTDVGTLKTNVTSLQTALTSKQDVIVGAASTITEDNLATDRALVSNSSGKVAVSNVTSTELGYLDGVTSNVQTQLDKKLEKAPVTSVNSKTGAVQLNASDVGALPDTTVIPSKTSQLDNDSGFITELPIASTTQLGGVKIGAGLSVTTNGTLSVTGGGTADAVEWSNVLDTPTAISGYGITDAKIDNGIITLGDKTITPYTADNPQPITYPVTSVDGGTGAVVTNAVKTVVQNLTNAQKTQARTNIGAGTSSFSGSYNDLSDKPSIPTNTSDLTNDSGYITSDDVPVKSVNGKTGTVVLGAADVGALPSDTVIPTVNDATLTIRRNGTDVGTFTANSANDVNIDIQVPTDKSDIGLGNVDNVKQYSASNPPPYPVTSVNGKTGDVTVDADLPEHLVKYQALSAVEPTTLIDANTLQGHDAAYFATASGLATANSNIATNTSDIAILQSGLSTANTNIANKLNKSGGTMSGALVAQSNANYATAQVRNIIISPDEPSGGNDGDIWIQYEA